MSVSQRGAVGHGRADQRRALELELVLVRRARAAATAAALPPGYVREVMAPVLPDRRRGFGPVTLLPLTMYIHEPSALKVTSCGSYAVGISPLTRCAPPPVSGMTAIELAPLLTAYRVLPSGEIVTADVAAPVYRRRGSMPAGPRASIDATTRLRAVSMTLTWSALSCAT